MAHTQLEEAFNQLKAACTKQKLISYLDQYSALSEEELEQKRILYEAAHKEVVQKRCAVEAAIKIIFATKTIGSSRAFFVKRGVNYRMPEKTMHEILSTAAVNFLFPGTEVKQNADLLMFDKGQYFSVSEGALKSINKRFSEIGFCLVFTKGSISCFSFEQTVAVAKVA